MSDSNFSNNTSDKDEPWADALVDTLLRETAGSRTSTEDFLTSIEKAIDAEDDPTSKIVPIAKPNPGKLWMWSSGIAAVLVVGVSAWLASVQIREERQMFAHTVTVVPESRDEEALIKKAKLKSVPKSIDSSSSPRKSIQRTETSSISPSTTSPSPDGANPSAMVLSSLDVLEVDFLKHGNSPQVGLSTYSKEMTAENTDSYGIEMNQEAEESVRQRLNYSDTEGGHTRTKMLSKAAEGWESPVAGDDVRSIAIGTGVINLDSSVALKEAEPQSYGYSDGFLTEAIVEPPLSQENARGTGIAGTSRFGMTESDGLQATDFFSRGGTVSVEGKPVTNFGRISPLDESGAIRAGGRVIVTKNSDSNLSILPNLRGQQASNRPGIESTEIGDVAFISNVQATEAKNATVDLTATEDLVVLLELPAVGKAVAPTARPSYGPLIDNPWASPLDDPLSTFSIDVDTASWTNLRAMIRSGRSADAIPNDAVRIEELINYFSWDYPQPDGEHPFAFATETAECPWNSDHRLMRVGIQGREIPKTDRPAANLVFLLDVSGSMDKPNKLPLVKRAISVLVEELKERDTVSIVVYAGAEGLALKPTSGRDQVAIQDALDNLGAGGSTNGGAGIKLAYRMAREQFVEDGINRVILCTDGDFNVGTTGTEELVSLVEKEAGSGVFLSVCGFGQDNLNDAMLEEITNKGNGNYAYIDDFREARKVFLQDMMGTLVTIAKDVKIQIEFNPAEVDGYRLIGYANRKLEAEDFENDEIDAGEVGSGHAVTALYEIVPAGAKNNPANNEIGLRYQAKDRPAPKRKLIPSGELALLKLRYKQPDGEQSILMEQPVMPAGGKWKRASEDFRFASAVGLFGMILREHESVGDADFATVIDIASKAKGNDPQGWRAEFVDLVKQLADR